MVLLISEDLMMSSTVSSAVRDSGGTFRFVKSVERAEVKLEIATSDDLPCDLLLVDLQTAELDWDALATLITKVPRAIAYAQHVNVAALRRANELPFEKVLTRGQLHAGVVDIVAG